MVILNDDISIWLNILILPDSVLRTEVISVREGTHNRRAKRATRNSLESRNAPASRLLFPPPRARSYIFYFNFWILHESSRRGSRTLRQNWKRRCCGIGRKCLVTRFRVWRVKPSLLALREIVESIRENAERYPAGFHKAARHSTRDVPSRTARTCRIRTDGPPVHRSSISMSTGPRTAVTGRQNKAICPQVSRRARGSSGYKSPASQSGSTVPLRMDSQRAAAVSGSRKFRGIDLRYGHSGTAVNNCTSNFGKRLARAKRTH